MYSILLNYTPHTINLQSPMGGMVAIEPRGEARVSEITTETTVIEWDQYGDAGMCQHIPLARKRYGDVTGLPDPKDGVLLIVSNLVQQALPERPHLVSPHLVSPHLVSPHLVSPHLVSPHLVSRDDKGRITGYKGFYRLG